MKSWFKRLFFLIVILVAGYTLLINALFLWFQYVGAFVLLYDPFNQTFDELSWWIFSLSSLVSTLVIVNYIKKLIRTFKNKRFSEKQQ